MERFSRALLAIAFGLTVVAAAPPGGGPSGGGMPGGEPVGPPPPPAPINLPSAAPTADPAMLTRAKNWFAALAAGSIDRSQLAATTNGSLTDAMIANAQKTLGVLGTPVSFVQQRAGTQGSVSYAVYLLTFKSGTKLDFFFAVDGQGKVAGLQIGQPQ